MNKRIFHHLFRQGTKSRTERIQKLYELTPEEKDLLSRFIKRKIHTQAFESSNEVVHELEAQKIIVREPTFVQQKNVLFYNIQPWAWEYLNQHPELLDLKVTR